MQTNYIPSEIPDLRRSTQSFHKLKICKYCDGDCIGIVCDSCRIRLANEKKNIDMEETFKKAHKERMEGYVPTHDRI